MQSLFFRFMLAVFILTGLAVSSLAVAGFDREAQAEGVGISEGIVSPVGLVLDRRGNLYAASRETGDVYCMAMSSSPVLLGRVPGRPTSLALSYVREVFVGTESGVVYGVHTDGLVEPVCKVGSQVSGLAVDRDGNLLIATDDGVIVTVGRDRLGRK